MQMVALNWQYINAATMLNQAMFESTGGWVLKPEGYRSQHPSYHQDEAMNRGTLDLAIEIFAGQNIGPPGKRLRLYVRCELHIENSEEDENGGLLEAGQSKEGQIKARTENASGDNNPDFKRQVLRFRKVPDVAEELTFIRYVSSFHRYAWHITFAWQAIFYGSHRYCEFPISAFAVIPTKWFGANRARPRWTGAAGLVRSAVTLRHCAPLCTNALAVSGRMT